MAPQTLRWAYHARTDLLEALEYLAEQSPHAAASFLDEIESCRLALRVPGTRCGRSRAREPQPAPACCEPLPVDLPRRDGRRGNRPPRPWRERLQASLEKAAEVEPMTKRYEKAGKRNLFREMSSGLQAMRDHRKGRLELRSHKVELPMAYQLKVTLMEATRRSGAGSASRAARRCRVSIASCGWNTRPEGAKPAAAARAESMAARCASRAFQSPITADEGPRPHRPDRRSGWSLGTRCAGET
jgi:plasmid stabilization system protein ParE